MARPRCRPFTLLDGMILIGVLAVGFAGARSFWTSEVARTADRPGRFEAQWAHRAEETSGFGLMLASTAWFLLRLRRPRASLRRIMRQPGAVACFVVVATDAIFNLESLVGALLRGGLGDEPVGERIWGLFRAPWYSFASIVPVSWLVLAMARRWHPEPGWVDRSGRALGWAWIAWFVSCTIQHA